MTQSNINKEQVWEEAEEWIVKLRSDELSIQEKKAFSDWLNQSSFHCSIFDEAYAVWETLGAVAHIPDIDKLQNQIEKPSFRETLSNLLHPGWFSSIRPWQSGLAFASVVALFSLVFSTLQSEAPVDAVRYASSIGETRSVTLEDGSRIELNTQSIVEVVYTDDERSLELLQGEVYFAVAKDPSRPFIVNFGKGSATAVGTAFNIYRTRNATAVTVTEGIVDVREAADLAIPNPDAIRVTLDQQVQIGRRGMGPVRNLDTSRIVAWRDQTIIFKDTPLNSAIENLNRYLSVPVDISKSELDYLKVSGTFSLSSPTETLDALATAFNLTKVQSSVDNSLYLRGE